MKRCPKCRNFMPRDETRCIRCGHDIRLGLRKETIGPVGIRPVLGYDAGPSRRWIRIPAAILTSKLFFALSFAVGTFAGLGLSEGPFLESGGHAGPDRRMMVVAMAPDPKAGGKTVAHQVIYGELPSFKAIYPEHSFLLPPGSGRVDNPAAGMSTKYAVQPAGAGKVLVETKFNQDFSDVFSRYEATEKEIQPLFSKTGSNYIFALTFGFALACLLGLAGTIIRNFDR